MFDQSNVQAKSRLGRMLVDKGMITSAQLDIALEEQLATGRKLGEILMARGWISSAQLKRALRKQTSYRTAAAFAAIVMGPIAPFASFAAPIGVQQTVEVVLPGNQVLAQPYEPIDGLTALNIVHYASISSPLMASAGVQLTVPNKMPSHYDNLCLRAPEALCS